MSLLGLDIGTTGCKAVAFNLDGEVLASSYRKYAILSDNKGTAELNSIYVWEKAKEIIKEVSTQTKGDPIEVLSISSLGEALVPVSEDRNILSHSFLSMDSRGGEYIRQLLDKFEESEIFRLTGNIPGSFYSLSKLAWIKNNDPKLYNSTDLFLSWADFISFMLGGEAVANHSLAARTLMFDIQKGKWSEDIIHSMGLDKEKLPLPCNSGSHLGYVNGKIADQLGLTNRVSIIAGGHDQSCAVLGSGIKNKSRSAMYGLGTFVCVAAVFPEMPEPEYMYEKRLHIGSHVIPDSYITFIYNLSGGALINWFKEVFGGKNLDFSELFDEISGKENSIVAIPKFGTTGPPDFHSGSQGCFGGLSFYHKRGDILQAILEGTGFYIQDCFEKSGKVFERIDSLVATGGGSVSLKWLQITADILNKNVVRNRVNEASSLGAAIIAGVGSGKFSSWDEGVDCMVHQDIFLRPEGLNKGYYWEKFTRYKEYYSFFT